jgi:hypothetical protein
MADRTSDFIVGVPRREGRRLWLTLRRLKARVEALARRLHWPLTGQWEVQGDPQFMLWRSVSLAHRDGDTRGTEGRRNPVAVHYYLWPDRLRLSYWIAGLFFLVWFLWKHEVVFAVAAFSWCVIALPTLLFYVLRRPVLKCIQELGDNAAGISVEKVISAHPGLRGFLPALFRPVDTRLVDPNASASGALLAGATADFFSDPTDRPEMCRRGVFRWYGYIGSPAWGGYLVLLTDYLVHAVPADPCLVDPSPLGEGRLALALIWMSLSAIYLWMQTCAFEHHAAAASPAASLRRVSRYIALKATLSDCPRYIQIPELTRSTVQGANLIPGLIVGVLSVLKLD